MEYLTFNDGNRMPMFGLGTWDLRGNECIETIPLAIDMGYRLIDTAKMYGNEKEIGKGIQISGIDREELFITTKIYTPDTSYKKAKDAIERALNNLQMDYVDLMLIHEPYSTAEDMYEAMKEAQAEGKIKSIGISNFRQGRYQKFIKHCGIIPAVSQVESHVYYLQKSLQEAMEKHGTKMQAWAPFTEGMRLIFSEPVLNEVGRKYGKTSAQVALRYLLDNGIGTVAKSSKPERLKENMDIFDFHLTAEDMVKISALDEGSTLFGWY